MTLPTLPRFLAVLFFAGGMGLMSALVAAKGPAGTSPAQRILHSLPSRTGLCAVVGFHDPTLATALSDGGRVLVHALGFRAALVEKAQARIGQAGLNGAVTVELSQGRKLPYSDHLVNLLVVPSFPDFLKEGLVLDELIRVTRPGGTVWLGGFGPEKQADLSARILKSGIRKIDSVEAGGSWLTFTCGRPASMDVWTQTRHDATMNPVSKDKALGLPSGVRWMAGPNWPTGHRKTVMKSAVITRDKLVYVFEDKVETPKGAMPANTLNARDASNGLLLWKRPADSAVLLAAGDKILTTVGHKLVALDANTGKLTRTYDGIAGTSQVLLPDGNLLADTQGGLVCLDLSRGNERWRLGMRPRKFLAGDGRVFLHLDASKRGGESSFAALDLKTGKELWKVPTAKWIESVPNLILYQQGILVAAGPAGNHALSAVDGRHLWSFFYPRIGHGGSTTKVLFLDGLVWVHSAQGGTKEKPLYSWVGLDPKTGKEKKRIEHPISKHRCYSDVAAASRILSLSMSFVDVATGKTDFFSAARASCRTGGALPANGLLYTFPHACGCYTMLRGFLGLAQTQALALPAASSVNGQVLKGPAFGTALTEDSPSQRDWATYRHDAGRSGSSPAPGPGALQLLWQQKLVPDIGSSLAGEWKLRDGGRVTSPVIASGLALLADSDAHAVVAFDARTGRRKWSFTAGGRIDSPPTVTRGRVLFGSHDGAVYCLRASDGRLVWKLRPGSQDRRIMAYGQLESAWPVTGPVLVQDGQASFTVGRHSNADGGIFVCAARLSSGELLWAARPEGFSGVPDVLNGGPGSIQMGAWEFDPRSGRNRKIDRPRLVGGRLGLLNDAWYQHPIATRKNLQAWAASQRHLQGQMLALSSTYSCGFRAAKASGLNGVQSGQAELFTVPGPGSTGKGWSIKMPMTARLKGMALGPNMLYTAGYLFPGPGAAKPSQPKWFVRSYAVKDGAVLREFALGEPVVHDCLALASGRLYVSTESGKLLCLGDE